jgi:hypothetical protein
MSHFYGKLIGKGETPRTITGTPNSGLVAEAMGMKGKIYVHVYNAGGVDYFEIFLEANPYLLRQSGRVQVSLPWSRGAGHLPSGRRFRDHR